MSELFQEMVLISLLGSLLAIGLLFIKRLFRQKLSANWHYYIWFILILRLLIPYTLPSTVSVFNYIPHYRQSVDLSQFSMPSSYRNLTTTNKTGENITNVTPAPLPDSKIIQPQSSASPGSGFNWETAAFIWLVGVSVILFYIFTINSLLLFQIRKLSVCDAENIIGILEECKFKLNIQSEVIIVYDNFLKSPALFGLIRPKLLISPEIINRLSSEELRFVFLHELSHLKRRDLLVNVFVLITQIVYWFNPVIWYALHQMKQDCEMACDETALSAVDSEDHRNYGQTIISLLQLLSEPHWAPGTLGFVSKFNTRRILMISNFKKTTVKWAIAALALTLVVGCSSLNNPLNSAGTGQNQKGTIPANDQQKDNASTAPTPSSTPEDSSHVVYNNSQYGFSFTLPKSWKGYSIISSQWEGLASGGQTGETMVEAGAMISIRHPQWTSQKTRQDIPIMVFTLDQWNSLQQGVFHIGAAPIGPSELGRNNSYVFALPARYNYSFPEGYKEVETILESSPLQTTQTSQMHPDSTETLLFNLMVLGEQGKVINSDFAVKTTTIEDVEKAWGKANQTDYVAAAKGRYATYSSHNVVFGINKGEQLFEVRSYDNRLKGVTLAQTKKVLGNPAYDVTTGGQAIIGYTAGSEFKVEMVFPQPTSDQPNPVMDHYNVLYPRGTVNSMADDPGRQW